MKLNKFTLKNNLNCLVIDEPFFNSIYLSLFVKVGSNDESFGKNKNMKNCSFGLAHFCEHMLFTGTKKRNEKGEIFQDAQSLGGKLNAYTAHDHTNYYMQYPKKYEKNAVELFADMYYCTNFRDDAFQGEKNIVNEEYKLRIDDPETYLYDTKFIINFKGSKYETYTPDILEYITNKYTKKQLMDFYYHFYRPENCVLVYCGKKDKETIPNLKRNFEKKWPYTNCVNYKLINSYDETWYPNKNYPQKSEKPAFLKKLLPDINYYYFKKNVNKSYFSIHFPNTFYHKNIHDRSIAKLFSLCVSGYMSSRLMKILRTDNSLVYGIDSDIILYKKIKNSPSTCFSISSSCDKKNFKKVIEKIINELKLIKKNGFTMKEIDSSKKYLLGNLTYSFENIDELSDFYGMNKLLHNKIYDTSDQINSINNLTKKEINDFARLIIDFENMNFLHI